MDKSSLLTESDGPSDQFSMKLITLGVLDQVEFLCCYLCKRARSSAHPSPFHLTIHIKDKT